MGKNTMTTPLSKHLEGYKKGINLWLGWARVFVHNLPTSYTITRRYIIFWKTGHCLWFSKPYGE